jgi:hypothetical protein
MTLDEFRVHLRVGIRSPYVGQVRGAGLLSLDSAFYDARGKIKGYQGRMVGITRQGGNSRNGGMVTVKSAWAMRIDELKERGVRSIRPASHFEHGTGHARRVALDRLRYSSACLQQHSGANIRLYGSTPSRVATSYRQSFPRWIDCSHCFQVPLVAGVTTVVVPITLTQ